ncbi:winged helix-turn-helix domain-containing protein [Cupriavidus sp. H18C2]|uniref:winged helix-turn-helix domain-containing protein n=1 Tax=Cupriavidus sp. H18C2 TaxID=3241602 RepID=UPI003BF8D361
MRILICESDRMIGDGLQRGLKIIGHSVDWAASVSEADEALALGDYEAVVVSLGPKDEGEATISRWRQQGLRVPIVALSARELHSHYVRGEQGVICYLPMPVSLELLATTLNDVTFSAHADKTWSHGPLEFAPGTLRTRWRGNLVELTPTEAKLLQTFLSHPRQLLTVEFLQSALFSDCQTLARNQVETQIDSLRSKIHPNIVRTWRGAGYTLGTSETLETALT